MGNCGGGNTDIQAPHQYTREEVKKHNTPEDCWIIIDNGVYDISDYWKIHPGASDKILQWAGKDATFIFREYNHSTMANEQLKTLGLLKGHLINDKGEDEITQYQPNKRVEVWKITDLEDLSYQGGENMFCFQCSATASNIGCTTTGICGKTASDSALQDLIVQYCKELSFYALQAEELWSEELYMTYLEATFSTLTNVNYDKVRHVEFCENIAKLRDQLRAKGKEKSGFVQPPFKDFVFKKDLNYLIAEGRKVGVLERKREIGNEDLFGLIELCTYGIKGAAAYYFHAEHLRAEKKDTYDEETRKRMYKTMFEVNAGLTDKNKYTMEGLLGLNMDCGKVNLEIMQYLDAGHTNLLGKPTPTEVNCSPIPGKCILVSGHDLNVLLKVLKQTEGRNINVYTHGEMLPAHGYPELKKYKHLVGNFGNAWYDQNNDFAAFPGAILLNSNCLQQPHQSYKHRMFTNQAVGWEGITHIRDDNYEPVIKCALSQPGFRENSYAFKKYQRSSEITGYGHSALADALIGPIKEGKVKQIILSGGCDNSDPERDFYKQQMLSLPSSSVVLTLGCGKFRLAGSREKMGNIPGTNVPRLLDVGQCNDSYSAVKTAISLAEILKCGVNDLPLRLVLAWMEQKSVVIFLSLLHLGIKNMILGPTLPAFLTPNLVNFLVTNFSLSTIANNNLFHSNNPIHLINYLTDEFDQGPVVKEFEKITKFQKYKLTQVEEVAKSTKLFTFAFRNRESQFSLQAGKHVMCRFKTAEGNFVSRIYTPINRQGDKGSFKIIVKIYDNGLVSTHLNNLKVGSLVEFQGGHGSNFYHNGVLYHEEKVFKPKRYNFIAGGTAFVQFFHIMQAICNDEKDRTPISMVASFLDKDYIILEKEFQQMQNQHKDHFRFKIINTKDDGFVNRKLFEEHLFPPQGKDAVNIICGPKKFVNACVELLRDLKFEESVIAKFF